MHAFKFTTLFLSLILASITSNAQQILNGGITVNFDLQSAKTTCQLLLSKKADTLAIARAAKLNGNSLLIKKVKGYSGYGEESFKTTLKEIITTGTIKGEDPYNWKQVKENLKGINQLISYLENNSQQFSNDVAKMIAPYTPSSLNLKTQASFIVGGGSLGFTIGNDPTFSVALQKIGDDVEGLKYLVAHELYHNVQSAAYKMRSYTSTEKPPYTVKASYALLYNLWAEGTANYIGDFDRINSPKQFSKIQQQLAKKNAERKTANFYLFETLLYRQYNDTTANYQPLYDIAYSTAFDESSYYVGQEMASKIDKHLGSATLAKLATKNSMEFTETYIKLYQSLPSDKSFTRFGPEIEKILEKLLQWKDKM